jgi:GAF domain-containing protein
MDEAEGGERALERALDLAIRGLDAESGTLHVRGDDGLLHLAAHHVSLPPPVLEAIRRIPVGKGMAGLAVERGVPVTACNLQTDDSGDVRPGARQTGLAGSIVVPLMDGERPVGALGVANRGERTFTDAEQELLLDIGRAIARRLAALQRPGDWRTKAT